MGANAHALLRARLVAAYLYADERAPGSKRRYLSWSQRAVTVRASLPGLN